MTPKPRLLRALALAALPALTAVPAFGAQGADPEWPCIQRKVPSLSLAQVWNGPPLPASAAGWSGDPAVSALVREAAARRVPIEVAQKAILSFAANLPGDKRGASLARLAQGLFEHMNAERSHVMTGIARYAKNQLQMAARIRAAASELAKLRAKPQADANELITRTEQMAAETRIFEERVQSLTYVCEVPTLIEQRLFSLSKAIEKAMGGP